MIDDKPDAERLLREWRALAELLQRGETIGEACCPWCGRSIVLDSVRDVSSHQLPTCSGWRQLMNQVGGHWLGVEILPYGKSTDEAS